MSRTQRIIAVVFVLVGLAALGVGAYLQLVPAIPPEFVGETQATITDIAVSYGSTNSSGRRSEQHSVLVSYEVDGKSYETTLGYYSTGMYTGQTVDIQYDTREPGRISSPGGRLFGVIITLALGLVFTVVGLILLKKPVPVFVNGRRVA